MRIDKQQIQKIMENPNLPDEANQLIRALIQKINTTQVTNESSSATPDLFSFKSEKKESLENQSKELEDIVLETQNYLRNNYTKAFVSISNVEDRGVIKKLIEEFIIEKGTRIKGLSAHETIQKIQDEILDFGQLNELIYDREDIEEIRINGSDDPVKIMIAGKQYNTDIILSPENVYLIAERMVRSSKNSKPLRKDEPFTRTRLANDIRVTVITDPIAREANNRERVIQMIIRKQASKPFRKDFLIQNTINEYGYELISAILKYRLSTIFYGGTNSGKTGTLRSFLHTSIPNNRRGISIAEIDEMNLRKVDPLTGKALNEIMMWELNEELMTFRKAVNAALTCTPQILILQEMKGEECVEVLDGSTTGHQIVISAHAEELEVLSERILQMYKQSGSDVQDVIILNLIPAAFPAAVQMTFLADGTRRITSVDEIVDYDKQNNRLISKNLLKYVIDDTIYNIDENGKEADVLEVKGHYEAKEFLSKRLQEKMQKGGMSQNTLKELEDLYKKAKEETCL